MAPTTYEGGRYDLLCLLFVATLSLCLNIWGNDFPLGFHFDEPKKVEFIQQGVQDFHHPLLLLQVARAGCSIYGVTGDHDVAIISRWTVALAGTGIVLTMFFMSYSTLGRYGALLAAFTTAITPTIVLHSHYIKEDIYLTLFSLFSLSAFARYEDRINQLNALVLGVALGLAFSSHYKSLLTVVAILIFAGLSTHRKIWQFRIEHLLAIFVSVLVFLLINAAIFESPSLFLKGVLYEKNHALQGDLVQIHWHHFAFGYHWIYSVMPGMTNPLAMVGGIAFLLYAIKYRSLYTIEKLLIVFGFLSYVVPEMSPSKPPPDDCRYILPLVPVLIYFFVKLVKVAWESGFYLPFRRSTISILVSAVLLYAIVDTVFLDYHMNNDSRIKARSIIEELQGKAIYEPMAGSGLSGPWGYYANLEQLEMQGYTHYVFSSFGYGQLKLGIELSSQKNNLMENWNQYQYLIRNSDFEFRPSYRQIGFNDPTVHVIDLSKISDKNPESPHDKFSN